MSDSVSRSKRSVRTTLGLLSTRLSETRANQEWLGMVEMAQQRDVSLIAYVGSPLGNLENDIVANKSFDLARDGRPDGLMIWTDNLFESGDAAQVNDFVSRYLTKPVVCTQKSVQGVTALLQDDYDGMRQVVTHLIEVHKRRRIVFLRGPERHFGAEERFRGYRDALADAGIAFASRLVSENLQGWAEGDAVMSERIDSLSLNPGTGYDAIVGCSYQMALSAMGVLQQHGIAIPEQVAIVGFGDAPENLICNPTLTTVLPPLAEMGQRAVETLLDVLGNQSPDPVIVQPTRLLPRQSCGCLEKLVADAALPQHTRPPTLLAGGLSGLVTKKGSWVGNIVQAFLVYADVGVRHKAAVELSGEIRYLVDAFLSEATGKATGKAEGAFLKTLRALLYQTVKLDVNVSAWQAVISALRQFILPYLDPQTAPVCENLWNQSRVMIGEIGARAQLTRLMQQEQMASAYQEVTAGLIAANDTAEIVAALVESLPKLGIPGCYLALYADATNLNGSAQLVLAYEQMKRRALPEEGVFFPAKQLIPDAYFPSKRTMSLVVEPLSSGKTALGFVVFELGPVDAFLYEHVCSQLSRALHKVKLVQAEQTVRLEAERQQRYEQYLFDSLMESLPDEIYFKDRQSRFILVNSALARHIGLKDASELLGKTDFDVFDEAHARPAFEDEQRIMETGEPLLGYEEKEVYSDGREIWVLTSKMPLVDANGEIVGTYGISRDITVRKLTEVQLEHHSLQLQTSAEVARAASSILDLGQLIQRVVDLIQERFSLYYVGLFMIDENGEWTNEPNRWAVLRAGTGDAAQEMLAQAHKLEISDTSMVGWCLTHQQPRVSLDVGQDVVRFRNPFLPLTRSELALPLISRGQILGALSIQSEKKEAFSEEDITIFQLMVDQLANAIANAHLYETTQAALQEMQATNRRYIRQGWERYSRKNRKLGYRQTEQGIQLLDEKTLPEVRQAITKQQNVTLQGETSTLVVPILLRDQPIGAVGFRSDQPDRHWTADEIAVIEVLTEQFAMAAENLRLLDETQRRAERERLTASITSHLRESLNMETILKTTVQDIQQALGLSEVTVRLHPPAAEQPEGAQQGPSSVTGQSVDAETKDSEL